MARIYMGGGTGDVEVPTGGGAAPPPTPPTLVATYNAFNPATVLVLGTNPGNPQPVASVSGVTLALGQKLIAHYSVDYHCTTVDVSGVMATALLTDVLGVVDEVLDTIPSPGTQFRTVTRTMEFLVGSTPGPGPDGFVLSPGIYKFSVACAKTGGLTATVNVDGPLVSPFSAAQLTLEIVTV